MNELKFNLDEAQFLLDLINEKANKCKPNGNGDPIIGPFKKMRLEKKIKRNTI